MGCRWWMVGLDNCLSISVLESENWIYTERREQQCTGARGSGARGGGASLVAELLDAPVLFGDFRLELVYAPLRTLKHALHLGLVRER